MEKRLRELLEEFVRTERTSPSLSRCLEERLAEALASDIDSEIVRNSVVSSIRPFCPNLSNATASWFDDSVVPSTSADVGSWPSSPFALPLMVRRKIHSIADQLANGSPHFRAFRTQTVRLCKELVHDLWLLERARLQQRASNNRAAKWDEREKSNGGSQFFGEEPALFSPPQCPELEQQQEHHSYSFGDFTDTDDHERNAYLALSSFSLEHSMQEWADDEMLNIIGLVISEEVEAPVRLTNVQKLHYVSPLSFSRSKAFDTFFGHLHAILPVPMLLKDTMFLLARILSCPDEMIWLKSSICLSRVALGVMRGTLLERTEKRAFADFFRQIFALGPAIWRSFERGNKEKIVQSFMEMLTAEISAGGGGGPPANGFQAALARADPQMDWVRPWLHRQSIRKMMAQKFGELVMEVLEHYGPSTTEEQIRTRLKRAKHLPTFWASQCCTLFHALRQPAIVSFLRESAPDAGHLEQSFCAAILHFLSLAFGPPLGQRKHGLVTARKVIVDGLLETTKSDSGSRVLASSGFLQPLLLSANQSNHPPNARQVASPFADLPLKVLLNLLAHSPVPPSASILPGVAELLRHHISAVRQSPDKVFPGELTTRLVCLVLEKFAVQETQDSFGELIAALIVPRLQRLDPGNAEHRRLALTFGHISAKQNAIQLRQLRKTLSKALARISMSRPSGEATAPTRPFHQWLTFPMAVDLQDCRSSAMHVLLQFVVPQHNETEQQGRSRQLKPLYASKEHSLSHPSLNSASSSAPSNLSPPMDDMGLLVSNPTTRTGGLDFASPLEQQSGQARETPPPVFFLITQPGLLFELLHSEGLGAELRNHFIAFERQKGKSTASLLRFIGALHAMVVNLDLLAELKHYIPNLQTRLVQLMHNFCSERDGVLLMDELSLRIGNLLACTVIASRTERRFQRLWRLEQIENGIQAVPDTLYRRRGFRRKSRFPLSTSNGKADDNETIGWFYSGEPDDWLDEKDEDEQPDASRSNGLSIANERNARRVSSFGSMSPLILDEDDAHFWFSVLPDENSELARRNLLRVVFSQRWQNKHQLKPFELLRAFSERFWTRRGATARVCVRPPLHSEWISLLSEYAKGLGLATNNTRLRQCFGALRLVATAPSDWFLSALFLASRLSPELTAELCERVLEHCGNSPHSLKCVWPLSAAAAQHGQQAPPFSFAQFNDCLTQRVYPLVLAHLRRHSEFLPLWALLSGARLPSLLHLLLFYTNQAYIGILPFPAVQEYLLLALLGGPELQALHFCAVIAHIHKRAPTRQCLHHSAKLIPLFLRPTLLDDFAFSKYVHLCE